MALKIIKPPHHMIDHLVTGQAKKIVDDSLGINYFNTQMEYADKIWFAFDDDEVVGFASVMVFEDYGLLKCSVVKPSHRGKGIGTRLVEERVRYLVENGCPLIRSNAWIVNGICNAEKTLLKNGFAAVEDIKGFYSDCYDEFNPCFICGSSCECFARIFEKKVNFSH